MEQEKLQYFTQKIAQSLSLTVISGEPPAIPEGLYESQGWLREYYVVTLHTVEPLPESFEKDLIEGVPKNIQEKVVGKFRNVRMYEIKHKLATNMGGTSLINVFTLFFRHDGERQVIIRTLNEIIQDMRGNPRYDDLLIWVDADSGNDDLLRHLYYQREYYQNDSLYDEFVASIRAQRD